MSQANIERIRAAYELGFARRTIDPLREHATDDFVWLQRPEWPGRSSYTLDQVPQLWADLDTTYSEFTVVPVDFAAVGDRVVVAVKTSARLRESDDRIGDTHWHVWQLRGGLIAACAVYTSESEALEAAGLKAD